MMEFYILNNNEKEGPFSVEALAAKNLSPDTLVWAVGYREWKPAKNVPELNDVLYSTPPSPPAQPPCPHRRHGGPVRHRSAPVTPPFSHTRPEPGYEPFEGASNHGIFPRTS